jgi:hypothetical protein
VPFYSRAGWHRSGTRWWRGYHAQGELGTGCCGAARASGACALEMAMPGRHHGEVLGGGVLACLLTKNGVTMSWCLGRFNGEEKGGE